MSEDRKFEEDMIDVQVGMVDCDGLPHVVINFVDKGISLVMPREQAIEFGNLIIKHARQN